MKKSPIKGTSNKFNRNERLKRRIDIFSVFKEGKSVFCPGIKLCFKENNLDYSRIAVSARRGYRNAVTRNRDKRIIREIYRLIKADIKNGFDIICVLFPGNFKAEKRRELFVEAVKKADLYSEGNLVR